VVADAGHIVGVIRVNTALRPASAGMQPGLTLREIASDRFTIVREDEVIFDVIRRIWRRKATMALVTRGQGVPRAADVLGVITKEHVADSVASSIEVYPSSG
jgi:CIC family chloride channel protein